MKVLIDIKNNKKCFLWCHIRHLNPLKIHPERITKADKNMVNDLDYEGIKFLSLRKILTRLERKAMFALMWFAMKITLLNLFIYEINNVKTVWIY